MINASEARSSTTKVITSARDTLEFKTAISKIEKHIKDAISSGNSYIRLNFCAMCESYYDFPSSRTREAVSNYVRENGYSYRTGSTMAPNGHYNQWFEIAW